MQEARCPMCMKMAVFNVETETYCRFQNTERLVCNICRREVENNLRPTWQIVAGRVFPRSLRNL